MKKASLLLFCLSLFLVTSGFSLAPVSGPVTVCPGSTSTYTSNVGTNYSWVADGGTIVGSSTSKTVKVQWGSAPQSVTVIIRVYIDGEWEELAYGLTVSAYTATAGTLSGQSEYCGTASGSISLTGNSHPVYRWESSRDYNTWTPIANQSTTHSFSGVTQNTIFRAVIAGNCGIYYYTMPFLVTVNPLPAPPVASPVSRCGPGEVVLVASGAPFSYVWYNEQGTYLGSGNFYATTLERSYNFKVTALSLKCESTPVSVTATINTIPAPPPSLKVSYDCGDQTVISVDPPPAGSTYYWQTSVTGTSEANSSLTRTVNTSAYYMVRAKNNTTQCWGPAVATYIQVYEKTAPPPSPQIELLCNKAVLRTVVGSPIIRYFWQTSPDGTDTSFGDLVYTVQVSGTYYLRAARTNVTPYCWSDAIAISVTIDSRVSCVEGQNLNYVITNSILREGVKDVNSIVNLPVSDNEQTISYLDGLGRPIQMVMAKASPQKKDVVQMITYDRFGRTNKSYLPYTFSADGRYAADALSRLTEFYSQTENVAHTTAPWSETRFEASPLSEVTEQGSVGEDWQIGSGHELKTRVRFNLENEVRLWDYDFGTGQCTTQRYYGKNQLLVKETVLDNHKSWIFTDKEGRKVLTKVQVSPTETALTYYVYDALSQLRMIIEPEGVKELLKTGTWDLTTAFIDKWCFAYQYDNYGRIAEKKIPGAQPVYIVYNQRDLPILSQDGNQRANNEWTFTKYDAHSRPVLAGTYIHGSNESQEQMQRAADSHTNQFEVRTTENYSTQHGYTIARSFPVLSASNYTILSVTYYDDYNFNNEGMPMDVSYIASGMVPEPVPSDKTINLVTATKTRILGSGQMLLTANFYDVRGNLIQTQKENHLGGRDVSSMRYDFADKVLESRQTHRADTGSPVHVVKKQFAYDHAGRLLKIQHQVNGSTPVTLSEQQYNELGKVVTKNLHSTDGTNYKQKLNYQYNIRGWLTGINHPDPANSDPSDLYGMQLFYNNVPSHGGVPYYNGNISEIIYNNLAANQQKAYVFSYDTLNRLASAKYLTKGVSGFDQVGTFDEKLSYDLNGNIKTLQRYALDTFGTKQIVDQLSYAYEGNKLLAVEDSQNASLGFMNKATEAVEYQYDGNGNMVRDSNKGIGSLAYNRFNLMEGIVFPGQGQISYAYDATGTRLSKTVTDQRNGTVKTRNYINGFEYNGAQLEFFGTEEGRVVMTGSTPEYQYHLKDHLGNVRVTLTAKEETLGATASLEVENTSAEQNRFLRYDAARKIQSAWFDRTKGTTPGYAQRLNGSANEKYGLAKSLSVMPGDKVKLEVFAKYVDTDRSNWSQALTNVVTAIASGTAPTGTVVDGAGYNTSTSSFAYPGLLNTSNSTGSGPKAFLNWLVFDRNFNLLDAGYRRMSNVAREYGQDVQHEKLEAELQIRNEGYVYAYLSNEETTPVEVYFDDFSVSQLLSPVVSATEYYPFGETFNDHQREHAIDQNYLYNGKEKQDEFNLDLYEYGARLYDPLLARWNGIDPLAEKYEMLSPFAYVANNPLRYVDPDGREIVVAGSPEFIKKFDQALNYLSKHGADGMFQNLVEKKTTYYIVEEGAPVSNAVIGIISWNPNIAMETSKGYILSAAEILNHEIGHVYISANDLERKGEDKGVIDGPEQDTGQKLDKLKKGQRTRDEHQDGRLFPTDDVTFPASIKEMEKYIKKRKEELKERERKQKAWEVEQAIRDYQWPGMTRKQALEAYKKAMKESREEKMAAAKKAKEEAKKKNQQEKKEKKEKKPIRVAPPL